MACAYSMMWITFVPVGDAGGHRLGSSILFLQGRRASMGGKENILPTPQTYWLDSTIFPERFGTSHFCLSVLVGTRRCYLPRSKAAAGNSWLSQMSLSHLPAAGFAEGHSKAALSLALVPFLLTLLSVSSNILDQFLTACVSFLLGVFN